MGRHRSLRLLAMAVVALLVTVLSVLPSGSGAAAPMAGNVHPALQQLAAKHPGQTVEVLVALDRGVKGTEVARQAGGRVMKEWTVSPTLHLELPARAVLNLGSVPGVRWVTPDAEMQATSLKTVYPATVGAPAMWASNYTGKGVTVAVVDSGLSNHPDLKGYAVVDPNFGTSAQDKVGHGTFVTGVISGNSSKGDYRGIAPESRIIGVKAIADDGTSKVSHILNALEWINANRTLYNIRVVNLSVQSTIPDSYKSHPLNAAVETLWMNGVVVVAAAGNRGTAVGAVAYPPANDPYIITVGSLDDNGTADSLDDKLAVFSSRGLTFDGIAKPDLVAPGLGIVSTLSSNSTYNATKSSQILDSNYLRASGTSISAPMVSGAAALLLQAKPMLTPDQVKWLLVNSAKRYPGQLDAAGLLDIPGALLLASTQIAVPAANTGLLPANGVVIPDSGAAGTVYWDEEITRTVYWDEEITKTVYWDEDVIN